MQHSILERQIDAALAQARTLACAKPDWSSLRVLLGEHNRLANLLAQACPLELAFQNYDLASVRRIGEAPEGEWKAWMQHVFQALTNMKTVLQSTGALRGRAATKKDVANGRSL